MLPKQKLTELKSYHTNLLVKKIFYVIYSFFVAVLDSGMEIW
jgi:hypothetical protein